MTEIDILIVEDKQDEIDNWEAAISDFNLDAKRKSLKIMFFAQCSKNYNDAKIKLRNYNFSAAIIDIRLKDENHQDDESNTDGNSVLRDIVNSTMCLACVYTGQRTDVDIPPHLEKYVDVFDRSAQSKTELLEILQSKLEVFKSIIKIKNSFSQAKATHFYSAIWPRWSLWSKEFSDESGKAIIRHMATHLHASFLNETDKVHPEEYYFTGPMIEGKLETGDITIVDGKHYILVTPRCEIAQNKNDYYQFVELDDKSEEMSLHLSDLRPLKESVEAMKAKVKIIKNSLKDLKKAYTQAEKEKNRQKTSLTQIINKAESCEAGKESSLKTDVVRQFLEAESAEKKAFQDISNKQAELDEAEAASKKADKAFQYKESAIKKLRPSSGGKISLHVLPEIKRLDAPNYGPLHARFEKIIYIDKNDVNQIELYMNGKYARLSNEFIPSFVERLGSHFSRIGTPDYSHFPYSD